MALVRQRRLHEAAKIFEEVGHQDAEGFALWRNRVWIALTLGQKTAAMTDIEQLAAHAHAHLASDHPPVGEATTAEFFGAVCGFLSGPWEHRVRPADAEKIERRLRGIFDDESGAAFDRSKTKVVERYQELLKTHDERTREELRLRTKQREETERAVGQAAKQLDGKQQALKDKQKKRTADAQGKIADLDQQLKKLDDDRQSLLARTAPLEAQRAALISQILPDPRFYMLATAANPRPSPFPDWVTYDYYFRPRVHNRQIMGALAPVVARVTALEAQVLVLNQREQELQFEQQAIDVKNQFDLGKLAAKEQALEKDRKRVENDTRRLKAKPLGRSPRLRAEAERLINFSTYAPFPFEREKERLLSEAE